MTEVSKLQNWSRNYTYRANKRHQVTSVVEVQQEVGSARHVGGLGTRHSFNSIADSDETLISLDGLNPAAELNEREMTVTVRGATTYGVLAQFLNERGYALHNMASLPHISVIGACMTGTHGSGERNGNLATAVREIEFVTADGDIVRLSLEQNPDEFPGLVVGLGAYGFVTAITLNILPTYQMRQNVYLNLPFEKALAHFDEIQASGYSVSLFTGWQGDEIDQVWVKQVARDEGMEVAPSHMFGALAAAKPIHPLPGLNAESCTEQLGVFGDWHDRLPHFRMDHTPSHGDELQTEYFVAREDAVEALRAVRTLGDKVQPLLHISEIRTIAADALWLSPCYGRDSVAIHFTWKPRQAEVMDVLPQIEDVLKPFGVRPHWGKLFTLPAAYIQVQYDRMEDFRELVRHYDPNGKFTNDFLRQTIFTTS